MYSIDLMGSYPKCRTELGYTTPITYFKDYCRQNKIDYDELIDLMVIELGLSSPEIDLDCEGDSLFQIESLEMECGEYFKKVFGPCPYLPGTIGKVCYMMARFNAIDIMSDFGMNDSMQNDIMLESDLK